MGSFFFLQWVNLVSIIFQSVSQVLATNGLELIHSCSVHKVNKEYEVDIKTVRKNSL